MSKYKVVPAKATDRMTWVGQSMRPDTEISIGSIYCGMLAASPDAGMVAVPRELLERVLIKLIDSDLTDELLAILEGKP